MVFLMHTINYLVQETDASARNKPRCRGGGILYGWFVSEKRERAADGVEELSLFEWLK